MAGWIVVAAMAIVVVGPMVVVATAVISCAVISVAAGSVSWFPHPTSKVTIRSDVIRMVALFIIIT